MGIIAAGTADGHLFVGFGGKKGGKKKMRKWEGLKADEAKSWKVADGPIIAVYVLGMSTQQTNVNRTLGQSRSRSFDKISGGSGRRRRW